MTPAAERVGTRRRPVQALALFVGLVFLAIGVLGFLPATTESVDRIATTGPHSEAMLLGVFQVSVLHNALHLLFGVAGVAAALSCGASRLFLAAGGFVHLLLGVYGTVVHSMHHHTGTANFGPFNPADNLLHLGFGAGMVLLAVLATAVEHARGLYPMRERRSVTPG